MGDKLNLNTLLAVVAEAQLSNAPATDSVVRSTEELRHELQVHEIELEMQNAELKRSIIALAEERKEGEARNQRMAQLYAALSQCNQAIMRCNNEEELFPQICRVAVTFGGMKMTGIGLLDEQTKQLKQVASYGSGTEYLDGIQTSIDEDEVSGRGPTGTAMREDHPFWCQDFMHDPVTAPWHECGAAFGWGVLAPIEN
ncbi:MAG: GAF domain-containing protein [Methylobacter sp.]